MQVEYNKTLVTIKRCKAKECGFHPNEPTMLLTKHFRVMYAHFKKIKYQNVRFKNLKFKH